MQRKRLDIAARRAHATDLATGLPNHAQLMEHMTHLLALRERADDAAGFARGGWTSATLRKRVASRGSALSGFLSPSLPRRRRGDRYALVGHAAAPD